MNKPSAIPREKCQQIVSSAGTSLAEKAVSGRFEWGTDLGIEADVEQYVERNLMRVSALLDDTAVLVGDGRLLGAAASARAGLETMAVLADFFRKFKSAVKRVDGDEIKRVLSSYIFASLEFSGLSQQKTPNVMDAVRNSEKMQNGMMAVYGVLCEAVHPNWSGRIQESNDVEVNWYSATAQRLVVAISISASFSTVLIGDLEEFFRFTRTNRRNLQNAILF
ncbi:MULTISPECIES: hypothetical protein [unclassified Leisingera]|uniref:hypothetical protein n=1 Tax=unclassified Leisingera TaxID=2614906 RepID=UPI00126A6E25|nr:MULTISPECIES: hypothetical protein [unclassified Leisingera]